MGSFLRPGPLAVPTLVNLVACGKNGRGKGTTFARDRFAGGSGNDKSGRRRIDHGNDST
jgi:hypothetical protein